MKEPPFYSKVAYVVVGAIGIGYLAILGKPVLCPLVFAVLFSLLLLPLACFFESKWSMKRGSAAALSVLLFVATLGAVLFLVGTQVKHLTNDWPALKGQLANSSKQLQSWGISKFNIDIKEQFKMAKGKMFDPGTSVISTTLLSVSSTILFLVFLVFDTFFLLFYRALLLNFLISVFKKENSSIVQDIVKEVQVAMRRYIIGLALEILIVAVACSCSFWAIGIKYPILFGLIAGLFNVIPYAGIFSALLIVTIITIATATVTKVLLVVAAVVFIHLVDSNVILPFVVGARVRINALITIVGLAVGEMMWHIPGMFLSIPVIGILKIICDHVDGLKPYGMLLGEEKKYSSKLFQRKKKLQPDQGKG